MPPVQAGMVPSALAAFSAPSGVSSAPSFAASSGVIAAHAGDEPRTASAQAKTAFFMFAPVPFAGDGSKRHLHARRREVSIVQVVPAACAAKPRPCKVDFVSRAQVRRYTEC